MVQGLAPVLTLVCFRKTNGKISPRIPLVGHQGHTRAQSRLPAKDGLKGLSGSFIRNCTIPSSKYCCQPGFKGKIVARKSDSIVKAETNSVFTSRES